MQHSSHIPTYQQTLAAIENYIKKTGNPELSFQHVAELVVRYQLANNAPYKQLCESIGCEPSSDWREIPAVTTDAFKFHSPPSCIHSEDIRTTFMTSGTTGETRGQHHFRSTSLYETSILEAWKQLALPTPENLFILTPSQSQAPHSSLSHMMETLSQRYCPSATYLIQHDRIDPRPLIKAIKQESPISIIGTALAFLNLFEILDSPITLPTGSWAMETGGYKGSGRTLTKEALYSLFQTNLGLIEENIWNEYSMTELSSQFYTKGIGNAHRSPHWMKIRVLDPETDLDVAPGEIGYLVIYDLANIDSTIAIRTQDLAIYHDEHHFTLIGRDPSALPRGCSRSIDDALNKSTEI